MITHELHQGSEEWHEFRAAHFSASDAGAMLGVSPDKTREDLLIEKKIGNNSEASYYQKKIFDDGHRFERLARPLAEEIVGCELYPATGSLGMLSASFDGITMLEDTCFEHKQLNADIAACKSVTDLPIHYRVQMEQQLLVSGAQRCLFFASKWDNNDQLSEPVVWFWYLSDPDLRQRIISGWGEFQQDLNNYVHTDSSVDPVGRSPKNLPELFVKVTATVTESNITDFKKSAVSILSSINLDLNTDQDFADADITTKWCKKVEGRLEAMKNHVLSQTSGVYEVLSAIDSLSDMARDKRLALEKKVKKRKDDIRFDLVSEKNRKLKERFDGWADEFHEIDICFSYPDFAVAIKGLKTIDSVKNALERSYLEAISENSLRIEKIRKNMSFFRDLPVSDVVVFPDLSSLVTKEPDDFCLAINHRLSVCFEDSNSGISASQHDSVVGDVIVQPAEISISKDEEATLKLSDLNERLGFAVNAAFLSSMGFDAHVSGNKKLYKESDFAPICSAIIKHLNSCIRVEK